MIFLSVKADDKIFSNFAVFLEKSKSKIPTMIYGGPKYCKKGVFRPPVGVRWSYQLSLQDAVCYK